MYFGDHFWSEHWGLHAEVQLRRVDGILKPQQLLIRPGLDYKLNDHLQFMVGYTNLQNYSYDRFSSPERITIHSIHEEATVSHPLGKPKFGHRFRLEQRFTDSAGKLQCGNRVRYRLSLEAPLTKRNYFSAYNEVFVYFGAHATRPFDQNRTYGAIGRDLGAPGKLEIGYLYDHQQLTDTGFRHAHAVQVSFFSKIPLRKRR